MHLLQETARALGISQLKGERVRRPCGLALMGHKNTHSNADDAEDVRPGMSREGGVGCAGEAAGSWDEAEGSDDAEGAEGLRGLLKRILEELSTNPNLAVSRLLRAFHGMPCSLCLSPFRDQCCGCRPLFVSFLFLFSPPHLSALLPP